MKMIRVTEALSPFISFDHIPPGILEQATQRGTRIHAAAAAYISGCFRSIPLLEGDIGYWESLKDWIDSMVDHVYDIEPELKDKNLGFMGHPDIICKVNGQATVIDWKTPQAESHSWRLQLSAYIHLASVNYRKNSVKWRGMIVQPNPEGKLAKAILYDTYARDFSVFLSCLNAYRFFKT